MPSSSRYGTSFAGTMPPTTTAVWRPCAAQRLDDEWSEGPVRAVVHRQADHVGVFLQGDRGDGLRRLAQTEVDDLHAGVAQDAGNDARPSVVTVEPDLRDEHPFDHGPFDHGVARSV